jgi:hypothetical protein
MPLCKERWQEKIEDWCVELEKKSAGTSPNRMAMKRRRIGTKVIGPGTPEAYGDVKLRA